jgi:hypothetical protein
MVNVLLKLLLKGTKNEAHFLNVAVSYCPRPPVGNLLGELRILYSLVSRAAN